MRYSRKPAQVEAPECLHGVKTSRAGRLIATAEVPLIPDGIAVATSGHSRTAAEVQAIPATIAPSVVGEAPSGAPKPTTVVGYIIITPVQPSDPFAVALVECFGERGFRCFVACAITRNDPDRGYTLN